MLPISIREFKGFIVGKEEFKTKEDAQARVFRNALVNEILSSKNIELNTDSGIGVTKAVDYIIAHYGLHPLYPTC